MRSSDSSRIKQGLTFTLALITLASSAMRCKEVCRAKKAVGARNLIPTPYSLQERLPQISSTLALKTECTLAAGVHCACSWTGSFTLVSSKKSVVCILWDTALQTKAQHVRTEARPWSELKHQHRCTTYALTQACVICRTYLIVSGIGISCFLQLNASSFVAKLHLHLLSFHLQELGFGVDPPSLFFQLSSVYVKRDSTHH